MALDTYRNMNMLKMAYVSNVGEKELHLNL